MIMWVKQYYVNKKSSLAAVQSCVQGVFFLLEFQFLKHVHKVYGIGRRITLRLLVPSAQPGNVYAALQAFSIDMLMHFARGLPSPPCFSLFPESVPHVRLDVHHNPKSVVYRKAGLFT